MICVCTSNYSIFQFLVREISQFKIDFIWVKNLNFDKKNQRIIMDSVFSPRVTLH